MGVCELHDPAETVLARISPATHGATTEQRCWREAVFAGCCRIHDASSEVMTNLTCAPAARAYGSLLPSAAQSHSRAFGMAAVQSFCFENQKTRKSPVSRLQGQGDV